MWMLWCYRTCTWTIPGDHHRLFALGVCNIVEYARKVTGEQRVVDIIGGFHLLEPSAQQLQRTLEYLQVIKPEQVHVCHCTDLPSKIALGRLLPLKEVGVELVLTF